MNKEWSIHIEFIIIFIIFLGRYFMIDSKIERQGERTDKLYEMWCETQKEIKQLYINWNL